MTVTELIKSLMPIAKEDPDCEVVLSTTYDRDVCHKMDAFWGISVVKSFRECYSDSRVDIYDKGHVIDDQKLKNCVILTPDDFAGDNEWYEVENSHE